MSNFVLIGASCEAFGHPTSCTEPAPGTVVSESNASVTINGTNVATTATADLEIPSHAHDYSTLEECHENASHTLDPDTVSSSVTLNGNPLYIYENSVATDPISGGNIDITSTGNNSSVKES